MTAKEFLEQVNYLDIRIRSNLQELADLRKMIYSVSSPSLEQSYNKVLISWRDESKQKLMVWSESKTVFVPQ